MNKDLRFNNRNLSNKEFQALLDTESQYLEIISSYKKESQERNKNYLDDQKTQEYGVNPTSQITEPAVTLTNNQNSQRSDF
jgi:hypothetical protein